MLPWQKPANGAQAATPAAASSVAPTQLAPTFAEIADAKPEERGALFDRAVKPGAQALDVGHSAATGVGAVAPGTTVAVRPADERAAKERALEATRKPTVDTEALYSTIVDGDLSKLKPHERLHYYRALCESLGLNPLTKPLGFYKMKDGKVVLYAGKECAAQLARLHNVSVKLDKVQIFAEQKFIMQSATATNPSGRQVDDVGAMALSPQATGDAAAEQYMKLATKAKRRAILSFCGLGALDESELGNLGGKEVTGDYLAGSDVSEARVEKPVAVHAQAPAPASAGARPAAQKAAVPVNPPAAARATSEDSRVVDVSASSAVPASPVAPAPAAQVAPQASADAGAPAAVDLDAFRFEGKPDRQWLIDEMKARFPAISKPNLIQLAGKYKLAASKAAITADLDAVLAAERAKPEGSALLAQPEAAQ